MISDVVFFISVTIIERVINVSLVREINFACNPLSGDSRVETTGNIFYPKSIQILTNADDIDTIGLRHSYVAEAYQGIEQAGENGSDCT